jgi:serine/threonine protein kinase
MEPPGHTGAGSPLTAGERVHARYRIERLLGKGAFGATYLVSDEERFGATCALKELQPRDASSEAKARQLFEREARVLLGLKHPQIPALHAYFEESGRYYLVQEAIDGRPLDRYVHEVGPLDEPTVRRIVLEVLGVLEYLHGRQPPVLHRDIKPSNLIRGEDGRVHVIDFGAVREALAVTALADTATTIGTPGYAPFEQALGKPTQASDLHALGMTALYLLSGRGPSEWRDPDTTDSAVLGRTGASPEFEGFLTRMIADPPDRFASAAQARAQLLGEDTRLGAVPVGGAATTVLYAEPARLDPPARSTPQRAGVSRRVVTVGGVVAVLAGLGIWTAVSGGNEGAAGDSDGDPSVTAAPPAAPVESSATTASGSPEVLDREARLSLPSGVILSVRHPASWQPASTGADGFIGLQEPRTNGVFVTGLDPSGETVPAFARAWALRITAKYGTVQLRGDGVYDAATSRWRFPLDVRRASSPESGLLIVDEPPPGDGDNLYRWWALLGQTDANVPTALAMANSLGTEAAAGR